MSHYLPIIFVFPAWAISYFSVAIVMGFALFLIESWTSIIINLSDNQLGIIFLFFLILFVNLLTVPYWQAVKAVTYYNLTHKPNYNLKL